MLPNLHPLENFWRQQVEACSTIHQGPPDPDVADGGGHDDAVLEGWSLWSKVTGVLGHLRGWEPPGAGDAAQTSLQRSLALLRDSGELAPPKMVATACCGSWKPKPAPFVPAWSRLS